MTEPEFSREISGLNGNTLQVQVGADGNVTVAVLGPRGGVLGYAVLDGAGVSALAAATQAVQMTGCVTFMSSLNSKGQSDGGSAGA
jgi:hypothetical protein